MAHDEWKKPVTQNKLFRKMIIIIIYQLRRQRLIQIAALDRLKLHGYLFR